MTTEAVERALLAATLVVLAAVGAVSAAIETFLIPQRIFGGVEGLSVVLAVLGNAVIGVAAGLATRTKAAAVVPTAAWFLTVGLLTIYLPGGDVIMPGQLDPDPGVVKVVPAFLIFGILAGALALIVTSRYTARRKPPTPTG